MRPNQYRVIQHVIDYEPSATLAGQYDKLTKAEGRAKVLVDGMKRDNKAGYVMIRDHVKHNLAAVYLVENDGRNQSENDANEESEDATTD